MNTAAARQMVIIVTTDHSDPYVYGPYANMAEAVEAKARVRAKWGDDDAVTGITIEHLRSI